METKERLGQQIQRHRKARGLTQNQLAEAVKIDSKSLSRLENGAFWPAVETLAGIKEALGVSWSELLDQDEESQAAAIRLRLFQLVAEAPDLDTLIQMEKRLTPSR